MTSRFRHLNCCSWNQQWYSEKKSLSPLLWWWRSLKLVTYVTRLHCRRSYRISEDLKSTVWLFFCQNRTHVMNDIFSEIVTKKTMFQYVIQIRTLDITCHLRDPTDKIVDKVIEECNSKKLREWLLKEHELTLEKLL